MKISQYLYINIINFYIYFLNHNEIDKEMLCFQMAEMIQIFQINRGFKVFMHYLKPATRVQQYLVQYSTYQIYFIFIYGCGGSMHCSLFCHFVYV